MRKFLFAIAGVAFLATLPVQVSAESRPGQGQQMRNEREAKPKPAQGNPVKSSYGTWQNTWGKAPPAPPKHWTRKGDWYRHVRACQQRYKSYSAKTDTYRTYAGKSLRCKL
mgnify:CR=1 FL=1